MPNIIARIWRGSILRLAAPTAAIGAILLWLIPEAPLRTGLDLFVLALSGAASVMYSYPAIVAVQAKQASRGQWLAFGVFCTQASLFMFRSASFASRTLFNGRWRLDDAAASALLMLAAVGVIAHLAAAAATDDGVPTDYWVKLGLLSGAVIFLTALALQLAA